MEPSTEQPLKKTCYSNLKLGQMFTFHLGNNTAIATMEWLWSKHINVLEEPSQIPDQNTIDNLWQYLNILCSQMVSIQSKWAWGILQWRIDKNFSLWIWKAGRDITPKTRSWNSSKRGLYKVLIQWRLNPYDSKRWLLSSPNYFLCHNKMFSPSKYCAFCVDQKVKMRFKSIWIPACKLA